MKISRLSYCLRVFLLTLLSAFANGVIAQLLDTEILFGTLGVMSFKFTAPSEWKIRDSPELNVRISDMLLDEGIGFKQNFVFANEKTGALLFGYWNEFPKGFAYEASQTVEREPNFPDTWGISPGQVTSGLRTSNKGLEYAFVRAVGQGDGKTFVGRTKSVKTLAIWANVPVQYESPTKAAAGMIMLQYRGPDFQEGKSSKILVDNQKMAGDILIRDLIDSLKLDSNVQPMAAEDYKAKYPKEGKGLSKEKVDSAAPSLAPQLVPADAVKSGRVDAYSKFPVELTQIINNARSASLPGASTLSVSETMLQKCQELTDIKNDSNLLELAIVIQDNYSRHRDCLARQAQWVDWYKSQKPKN
jgi:hypothetical protein